MAAHLDPNEPRFAAAEPAALAETARLILAALVAGGWLALDSVTAQWIVTGVGLVASVVLTGWTRGRVTPLAAPRTTEGAPLRPTGPGGPPAPPTTL